MAFYVGQKVVCVRTWDVRRRSQYRDEVGPVSGTVYTVRAVGMLHPAYPDGVCLLLEEIKNPVRSYYSGKYEASFCITRFRPVVERKTDISCLKALLVPGPRIREPV